MSKDEWAKAIAKAVIRLGGYYAAYHLWGWWGVLLLLGIGVLRDE